MMKKRITVVFVVFCIILVSSVALTIFVQPKDTSPNSSSNGTTQTRCDPDSWTNKTAMPTTGGTDAVVVDGKIYVFDYQHNYVYDPANDSWQIKTPMPTPRSSFGVAACQGKIFVIGGINASNWVDTAINEVYDPKTDTWTTETSMPTTRNSMKAETVDGKIYVISGRTDGPNSSVKTTLMYDPVTNSWTSKSPIPNPVTSYGSTVLDGKIYVIGGQDEYHDPMNSGFVQIYDPAKDSWTLGTPHPHPAWIGESAVATTGLYAPKRIYVLGGAEGFGVGLSQNFVYDPETDSWGTAASMLNPKDNFAVGVVDDLIYAMGGTDGWNGLNLNEQYTPIGYKSEIPQPQDLLVVPDDFSNIQTAINNVKAGGTVFVKNGSYNSQSLNIIKPLKLIGESPVGTVLKGQTTGEPVIVTIVSDDVQISNFTFYDTANNPRCITGLGSRIKVAGNIFINSSSAIELTGSSNTVTDNTIQNTYKGVSVYGSNNQISRNILNNSSITLSNANYNIINNNTVTSFNEALTMQNCSYNVISGNIFEKSQLWAVLLGSGSNNVFCGNLIRDNTGQYDGYGLALGGYGSTAENNLFYWNTFVNNNKNVGYNWPLNGVGNSWNKNMEGNYWSDYNGTDSNGDGIVDTPYIIDDKNVDHYPLMKPLGPVDFSSDIYSELAFNTQANSTQTTVKT
jgi:parallel beta-helix repeat protein